MKNEPAFPVGEHAFTRELMGMTLRDYFAAKAMAAIIAGGYVFGEQHAEKVPKRAYEIADAMLKEREE